MRGCVNALGSTESEFKRSAAYLWSVNNPPRNILADIRTSQSSVSICPGGCTGSGKSVGCTLSRPTLRHTRTSGSSLKTKSDTFRGPHMRDGTKVGHKLPPSIHRCNGRLRFHRIAHGRSTTWGKPKRETGRAMRRLRMSTCGNAHLHRHRCGGSRQHRKQADRVTHLSGTVQPPVANVAGTP